MFGVLFVVAALLAVSIRASFFPREAGSISVKGGKGIKDKSKTAGAGRPVKPSKLIRGAR
jgi:hypothetical protein